MMVNLWEFYHKSYHMVYPPRSSLSAVWIKPKMVAKVTMLPAMISPQAPGWITGAVCGDVAITMGRAKAETRIVVVRNNVKSLQPVPEP